MVDYRERLRTGQIISDAVPIQQRLPESDINKVEADGNIEDTEGGESLQIGNSSGETDSNVEKTFEKVLDMDVSSGKEAVVECSNAGMETSAGEGTFDLKKRVEKVGDESNESIDDVPR